MFCNVKNVDYKAVLGDRGITPYGLTPLHYLPIMLYSEELFNSGETCLHKQTWHKSHNVCSLLNFSDDDLNTVIKRAETVKASP